MRLRSIAACAFTLLTSLATAGRGQTGSMSDGLIPGDYLRVAGGLASPISPQGSLRDWERGGMVGVAWENWAVGSGSGVASAGFSFVLDYARFPLNASEFIGNFQTVEGTRATSATASDAQMLSFSIMTRIRIPSPFAMPSVAIGFGVLTFRPGTIDYNTATTHGTTKQNNRTGAQVTIGGGVDKLIYDRYALFADALYIYGFTGLGRGSANPSGICPTNGCDVLKNTSIGAVRGGLRIRIRP